ncbi:extracellular solute-binding protein [Henriciella aquimarina]|uniref:extracellular solute-binding protein n=1 Tax=Henriciella aquimarina TaxID=545261 RepID=UPI0009FFB53D|nr:extracellular solute-binding protein [Henriciella aquimarina]
MSDLIKKFPLFAVAAFAVACSPSTPASESASQEGAAETESAAASDSKPESGGTLRVYSARHYDSDRLMYEAFEDETGIRVLYREAGANQLLQTMKAEGARSPADLIIASDAGALWRFEDAGLTQALPDGEIEAQIPPRLLDEKRQWIGLSQRVRGVAYDPERINPEQVDEWMDLADPALEGEICVRSSTNVYNLSLMGEMIERWGADQAQAWADGVVANMARDPQGGDTDQIEGVAAGLCSIAITNHYYWVRMAESSSNSASEAAEASTLIFPTFGPDTGAHVNITGVAIAAHAENKDAAIKFIDWLYTPHGQALLVDFTKEIPVNPEAERPQGLDRIPEFTDSDMSLSVFGEHQAEAQRIFDEAGWD